MEVVITLVVLVPVHPPGSDQTNVADGIAATEYDATVVPEQTTVGPEIGPGEVGMVTEGLVVIGVYLTAVLVVENPTPAITFVVYPDAPATSSIPWVKVFPELGTEVMCISITSVDSNNLIWPVCGKEFPQQIGTFEYVTTKILFGAVPIVLYVIELVFELIRSVQNKATTPFGVEGSGMFPPEQHPQSVLVRSKVINPFETI
jgi:hypothetical protein